jgi:hypothetical protein
MPASPTAVAATDAGTLVVFREPATGFSTTDVHDAHDRIVQFTTRGDLVWTPDGTHIPGYLVALAGDTRFDIQLVRR